jgi:hypothetical protein
MATLTDSRRPALPSAKFGHSSTYFTGAELREMLTRRVVGPIRIRSLFKTRIPSGSSRRRSTVHLLSTGTGSSLARCG